MSFLFVLVRDKQTDTVFANSYFYFQVNFSVFTLVRY